MEEFLKGLLGTTPKREQTEEETPARKHFIDPVEPSRYLCGKTRDAAVYHKSPNSPMTVEEVECVVCADMMVAKGYVWWWRVHRAAWPDCSCIK